MEEINIIELVGQTFDKVDAGNAVISFYQNGNLKYEMSHDQECCEKVTIDDIIGDLQDLENSPILQAEESQQVGDEFSSTWTFYKFATIKGYVTIRWYGESNGYYSETAKMYKLEE